ncbi:rhomboid family intramembrane serine protease [Capnocytophaga stomatis]|uniref:Rhomboid family intramembrane serine protease n=1 Tax=Capnocytophaga stomatis TaxID=1848904 RepID=A0A250FU80_9FLAO|nr:rhomboid family intramembrane serine protease [Capnocytophaga stomatis]ATA88581.1 rhomboid family intramembrane serine protease [Capnocytophaga stomatis]GIJ93303.1 rhomboid family intramembrane serine protease [Capnocytophaga stomatis]GIJ96434.1 rhomboid family intramembrane serine protease [Capnocytophaga stomatis]GIM50266.1 rhomboid family intramembrane serine protease [Capnocytophaga stomatis]
MERITQTVKHLIIINAILFVVVQYNLIPSLNLKEITPIYFFENPQFNWWQVISHMFMHGDWAHLFFNMYALWAFGSPLEHIWGRNKFLFFYLSCGIGAALIHSGVNYYYFQQGLQALEETGFSAEMVKSVLAEGKYNTAWEQIISKSTFDDMMSAYFTPAVGASGAIYGILAAFAMMFPDAKLMLFFIPYPIKAKYFIPIIVGLDLFSGVTGFSVFGGNIAHFAHVGGALMGFLMMWYWRKKSFDQNRWDRR